jgi:dTDP-4-amino-4,6-dideoxygalactose transaminase
MIPLFNIRSNIIDTSKFSNLLHDEVVLRFEKVIAEFVGAKYACGVNSATSAIFLSLLNKNTTVTIPSVIPPVVANAVLTSGNNLSFSDNIRWVGDSYILHKFEDYKIIDSAQRLEKNQFKIECDPQDLMIFSFYPTKPLGGSDGGMIVTDDYEKYKWFKEATLNGMTYADDNWERKISFPGYKMYMSAIQAAILIDNFKHYDDKMGRIKELVATYNQELGYNNTSGHLYRIDVGSNKDFIQRMKSAGISCGIHYAPLHLNPVYNKGRPFACHDSEKIRDTTVSLPMNETLTPTQIQQIICAVRTNA